MSITRALKPQNQASILDQFLTIWPYNPTPTPSFSLNATQHNLSNMHINHKALGGWTASFETY
jgi:hypothetical protein